MQHNTSIVSRLLASGLVALAIPAGAAAAAEPDTDGGVPIPGTYIDNYLQPEYLVPWTPVDGAAFAGDLSAQYQQLAVPVVANREILLIGEFPAARYFSLILYDHHGAVIDALQDFEIEPLRQDDRNPFRAGGTGPAEDQLYAVTIRLGESLATSPAAGCDFGGLDVHTNLLDARASHTAGDFYSCQTLGFEAEVGGQLVVHDDDTRNNGAVLMIRHYLPEGPGADSAVDLRLPLVWVRDAASGCPAQVAPAGTLLRPSQWYQGFNVSDTAQISAHIQHERNLGRQVSDAGADPFNGVIWWGSSEYILRSLVDAYVSARLPADKRAAQLNAAGRVLRLRFRMPEMPGPDCRACALSGQEQLRYWSLSFADFDNNTVATLSDLDVITGGQGYATVIVTFGTPLPDWVNAGVNYTVLDLSRPQGEERDIKHMSLRNILPADGFACATNNVPPRTHEYHSEGGYMGEYLPIVDYPVATELPKWARPLTGHGGTCVNPTPPPDPCS